MSKGTVKYDYTNNKVTVLGYKADLDHVRDWIRDTYRPLTERYKIKTIRKNSVFLRYYDWEHILNLAREELIILEWYAETVLMKSKKNK